MLSTWFLHFVFIAFAMGDVHCIVIRFGTAARAYISLAVLRKGSTTVETWPFSRDLRLVAAHAWRIVVHDSRAGFSVRPSTRAEISSPISLVTVTLVAVSVPLVQPPFSSLMISPREE
jgi:hypothetical protein